ncbi:glycosyltransferase [Exiguobacterium alkaliphilum]|uniref:glycosyltransferase n=1 Tax=Exiguobacterium alkaliphilum TaxID=1428684 RepID=UPI001BAA52EC|nr:glycosyltransferase [Exiguobacterium alkaliphilum]QUE87199.1 glycosyltransferase [Exiguobacterium alkaliphilum]
MKKILIITARAGFPHGYGASSILRKYSKGFVEKGYFTKVLLLRPSEEPDKNTAINDNIYGVYDGVNYEYMSKRVHTSRFFFARIFLYLFSCIRTLTEIFKNRREIERIFFYSPDYLLSVLSIQLLCKVLKIPLIGIKTESSEADKQRIKNPFWKLKEKILYSLFSSMIVITKYLKNQLQSFGYKGKISVLPIIVNENMYNHLELKTKKNKSLVYMGTLNYEEELIDLLTVYSHVKEKNRDWSLIIIGEFRSEKLKQKIKKIALQLNLKNDVIWKGKLLAEEVSSSLINEGVMVLPRRKTEYSEGGFPIKLGEYLLTGSPVIVTRTGEIDQYLEDGKDVFMVEPNNPYLFASKVNEVIENYDSSLLVGKQGKEVAIKSFGSVSICQKMLEI